MVSTNQILLFGGIAVGGYFLWQSGILGQLQAAIQNALTPPSTAAAPASGASSMDLTGGSTVGTGVNNAPPDGSTPGPYGINPTVSGGVDVGGAGVDGPTFTDPVTGQQYNPSTGQILSPGGSTQIPNFAPFVEPGAGYSQNNLNPLGGPPDTQCPPGTRFSQCFQACQPAGILEPAPTDPRCVGVSVSHSPNPDPSGAVPTPTPVGNTPPPVPGVCQQQFCGAGGQWDFNTCRCVPVATPPPVVTPPVNAPPPTVITPPVSAPPVQSGPNCRCCLASPHNGNCHSECNWGKSMTSSRCLQCLSCCGDYQGNACRRSHVGYAYQGTRSKNIMGFANEGMMISAAAMHTPPRQPFARVVSRSRTYAPGSITNDIFARRFIGPNRVSVS